MANEPNTGHMRRKYSTGKKKKKKVKKRKKR